MNRGFSFIRYLPIRYLILGTYYTFRYLNLNTCRSTLAVHMRLQKQKSRKVGNKEYSKYVIIVPPDRVERLGWHEGEELADQVQGKKLIIASKSMESREKER